MYISQGILYIILDLIFFTICSLLDIVAARKNPSGLQGTILVNGEKQPDNFKCMTGYVVQVCFFPHKLLTWCAVSAQRNLYSSSAETPYVPKPVYIVVMGACWCRESAPLAL